MKIKIEPEADEEISEATWYLAQRSEQGAAAFPDDLRLARDRLQSFTNAGSPLA